MEVLLDRVPLGHISVNHLEDGRYVVCVYNGIGGGEGKRAYYQGATVRDALVQAYNRQADMTKESEEWLAKNKP